MSAPKNRYKFNPFNLPSMSDSDSNRIKFERLNSVPKTKSIWWLIALFLLMYFIYKYLNSGTLN